MIKTYRGKLILLIILALAMVQIGSSVATLQVMRSLSQEQAVQSIKVGGRILDEVLRQKELQYRSAMGGLSADFGFKSAVATQDVPTLRSTLENHALRIDADLALLINTEGQLQLSAPEISTSNTPTEILLVDKSPFTFDKAFVRYIAIGDYPFMVVFSPVRAPDTIGWVGMGFLLDNQLAQEIKSITSLDVGFVTLNERLIQHYSTRDINGVAEQLDEAAIQQLLSKQERHGFATFNEHNLLYIDQLSEKTLTKGQKLYAYLYSPDDEWLEKYYQLRDYQLIVFLGSLIVAISIAIWLAREISNPILTLVTYARDIGLGKAKSKPKVKSKELTVLSSTLEQMDSDIKAREKEIVYKNTHDLLTGLANRTASEAYLSELRKAGRGCLALINIKKFKLINDSLGYANGDLILQAIARRLQRVLPETIFKSRLGGDEFLIASENDLTHILENQLLPELSSPIVLAKGEVKVSYKIGMCHIINQLATVSDLMRWADIALNEAKKDQRELVVYKPGQDENYQRQLQIIASFESAMQEGDLYVEYQPKVNLRSMQCSEAEALLRWHDKRIGLIAPEEFVRLAELSGNIRELTNWAIDRVIKQIVTWQGEGHCLRVAINISVDDLLDRDFRYYVRDVLRRYDVAPSLIAFEVTESVIMSDPDTAIDSMLFFKEMGIHLSIDDFGTGYSSLSYLKKLPVHELKVDKSFIKNFDSNEEDHLLAQTSIELAHNFGLKVVAEGVETSGALAKLISMKCDTGQGYFFSRSLDPNSFIDWLSKFNQQS